VTGGRHVIAGGEASTAVGGVNSNVVSSFDVLLGGDPNPTGFPFSCNIPAAQNGACGEGVFIAPD
jgi:hypothetical protein